LNSRCSFIDNLQPRRLCAAKYFSSRSSTSEQRLHSVVDEQRLRSTVNEQRATASSASDDVVADDELEQTSAQTVALFPTIVWHVTVRTYVYIDDIVVVIIFRQHFSVGA
jgi:hypothetical protein